MPANAPSKIAGPESPVSLHSSTPKTATPTVMRFVVVIFCMHSRQMKIEVMANDAMAVGTDTRLPMSAPMTQANAHDD